MPRSCWRRPPSWRVRAGRGSPSRSRAPSPRSAAWWRPATACRDPPRRCPKSAAARAARTPRAPACAPRSSAGSRRSACAAAASSRSAAMRSLPRQDMIGERAMASRSVGAISEKPSGTRTSLPRCTMYAPRGPSSVLMISPPSPSCSASSMAHGFSVRIESGPVSTTKPSRRSVPSRPPTRCAPSNSSTCTPRCFRRYAAVSPLTPPPTTQTRIRRPRARPPPSRRVSG